MTSIIDTLADRRRLQERSGVSVLSQVCEKVTRTK